MTYIGLRSPPSSIELFFVVKVIGKDIAVVPMTDKSGHTIEAGEPYLRVIYLDVKSQSNSIIE